MVIQRSISTPIRILMINTVKSKYDGITMTILNYISNMDKEGIQIDFLAINHVESDLKEQIESLGSKIHTLTSRNSNPLVYVLGLAKIVRKNKYQVVHIHCNSRTATFDLLGAYLGGAKLRCPHSHNTQCENPKVHKLLKPIFNLLYTDAFACGKDAGKWLYENRPFTVLKNGTNLNKYQYNEESRNLYREKYKLGITIAIGHVAHFTRQKNHSFLIEVFKKLIDINSNYKLFLIGEGKYKKEIEEKVANYNLEKNIVFTGTIQDIPEMLSAMDLMVLPSLHEGLPNVVIEWQVSGIHSFLADTITKDCKLTSLVDFFPLDVDVWVNAILNYTPKSRENYYNQIAKAGFDISVNAESLKQYYLNNLL